MDKTPETEVSAILSHLEEIYSTILENMYGNIPADEIKNSFKAYCAETWADEKTNGEELAAEFNRRASEEGDQFVKNIGEDMPFLLLALSIEYCVQAMKANDLNMAWGYITEANFWRWYLNHTIIREEAKIEARSETGRANNNKKLESDPKHQAMNSIESEFYKKIDKFEQWGYQQEFVDEQAKKHPVISDPRSIYNKVTRLKKIAGVEIKRGLKN